MLEPQVNVYRLPRDVDERALEGSTVIVIDLLRATTTICQALAAGASEVVPFRTIEETLAAVEKAGRANVMLGGERGGRRIEGFDLGNSPSEYTPESVGGRRVFITTTNGTQALYHARHARRVLVGAIVNLSAVVASVKDEPRIDIICAGTDGHETREDILAAGAIELKLGLEPGAVDRQLNEMASFAGQEWWSLMVSAEDNHRTVAEELATTLRDTRGGRNLIDVGLAGDLADCAQIDWLNIVPQLDTQNWRITSLRG